MKQEGWLGRNHYTQEMIDDTDRLIAETKAAIAGIEALRSRYKKHNQYFKTVETSDNYEPGEHGV